MLETFEEAATDSRKFRRLAALAKGARGAQQPPRVCDAGHGLEPAARRVPAADGRRQARMPPPEDGQTLMTDYPAA